MTLRIEEPNRSHPNTIRWQSGFDIPSTEYSDGQGSISSSNSAASAANGVVSIKAGGISDETLTIFASLQDGHTAEATGAANIAAQLESFDIESGEYPARCTGQTYETFDCLTDALRNLVYSSGTPYTSSSLPDVHGNRRIHHNGDNGLLWR